MPMPERISPTEAAARLGVSVRTLDRYDAAGITTPIRANPRGYRRYDADAIDRLAREGVPATSAG